MAAGEKEPPNASDDESPAPKKSDVRVGSHDDMGVHVSRDLRAQGPSARGWNSNMSRLDFSARALPRDENEAPEAEPVASTPPAPPAASADVPADAAVPAEPGLISKLAGLFRR